MTWYAAHILVYAQFLDGTQVRFPVQENVVLVGAPGDAEALQMAEQIGVERYARSDSSFTYENRPARWVFAGIRKLIACQFTMEATVSNLERTLPDLLSGTEITYSLMEVDSLDSVTQLALGSSVYVQYEE